MRRFLLTASALAAACSHGSRGGETEEVASRYERGDGVPRDYTRAIQIHQARCDGGDGDLVACRKLVFAELAKRGELRDAHVDVKGLLTRACHGGDWLACVPDVVAFDARAAQAACDADQPAACLAITWTHFMNQSGSVEFADDERRERACHGGVLDACVEIVKNASYASTEPPAEAAAAVHRACDRGDADACAILGKPIDPAALCRAHDFGACAQIGVVDPGALTVACDHGVTLACEQAALAARDADPPDPQVAERFARACAVGSSVACRQNRPADLAIGCAAYQMTRVPPAKRRPLPPLRGTVAGAAWRAPADHPFVVLAYDARNGAPSLYADIARRLGADLGVYVLVDRDADPAAFAPAIAVVLDPSLAEAPLADASGASVGDPIGLHLGNGWPTIVDAHGAPRAILATEWGLQPVTLARCARGVLAEP